MEAIDNKMESMSFPDPEKENEMLTLKQRMVFLRRTQLLRNEKSILGKLAIWFGILMSERPSSETLHIAEDHIMRSFVKNIVNGVYDEDPEFLRTDAAGIREMNSN